MSTDLTFTFDVPQPPEQAFAALLDVRAWWTGEVEGDTATAGEVWSYAVPGMHFSRFRTTVLDPGRRLEWLVLDSELTFVEDRREWDETTVVFDLAPLDGGTRVTFTHVGLTPAAQCYDQCSIGWNAYAATSLREHVTRMPVAQEA